MSELPETILKSSKLFDTDSCQIEDFWEFSKSGLINFKKSIIVRKELLKARRLDRMLGRAFILLKQSQTIHKPRGRRSTCNLESISCSFKKGFQISIDLIALLKCDKVRHLSSILKIQVSQIPQKSIMLRL